MPYHSYITNNTNNTSNTYTYNTNTKYFVEIDKLQCFGFTPVPWKIIAGRAVQVSVFSLKCLKGRNVQN